MKQGYIEMGVAAVIVLVVLWMWLGGLAFDGQADDVFFLKIIVSAMAAGALWKLRGVFTSRQDAKAEARQEALATLAEPEASDSPAGYFF